MNERVTVNGAVFFVGWRLTPYPTYRYLALLSAMRAGNSRMAARCALSGLPHAPIRSPAKRSASRAAAS
ncbi:hypothetical protein EAO28_07100 [Klebsiella pneumoniae]|uniref:Uncharacterized protein n=1 Tax=Klebsiella pneumoniae TaxID=573 RepID=A0A3P2EG20_KLEPN|nr:hypothetical protein EAO28_07100 [Klebsiella pneumoniae]